MCVCVCACVCDYIYIYTLLFGYIIAEIRNHIYLSQIIVANEFYFGL